MDLIVIAMLEKSGNIHTHKHTKKKYKKQKNETKQK